MRKTRYKAHTWKAQCDVSGLIVNSDQLVRRWDGRMCLPEYCDERHPQETIKIRGEKAGLPWNRPINENYNTNPQGVGVWTVGGTSVVAPTGYARDSVELERWINTTYTEIIS